MKHIFFATFLLLTACTTAKPTDSGTANDPNTPVSFWVRNNSLLPHKYALIGYEPGMTGNWTTIITLAPGARKRYKCPVGTKIYLANDRQVGTVMGGGSIRNDQPFITVKAGMTDWSFKLR